METCASLLARKTNTYTGVEESRGTDGEVKSYLGRKTKCYLQSSTCMIRDLHPMPANSSYSSPSQILQCFNTVKQLPQKAGLHEKIAEGQNCAVYIDVSIETGRIDMDKNGTHLITHIQ